MMNFHFHIYSISQPSPAYTDPTALQRLALHFAGKRREGLSLGATLPAGLWITFPMCSLCQVLKKQALLIRFATH